MSHVVAAGPEVTILPEAGTLLVEEVPGWDGSELYPCRFCGSTGWCEHLMRVLWIGDENGGKRSIPMRAELGPEWGRRRLAEVIGGLARVYLQSRSTDGMEER